ncbi:MAG: dTMP kinase [Myxococcota bacterium]
MGRFIVFEGLDGAGTTTQCDLLVARLTERPCGPSGLGALRTAEPTAGPIGRIARETLGARPDAPAIEVLPWLFAADRADHLSRTVLPALAVGRPVVCDRYVPSSLAYQSLTMPLGEVWSLNRTFRVPDLVLYVDVPVDTALARIDARKGEREIYDDKKRLTQIRDAYERVMGFLDDEGWPIVRIDGRPPVAQVAAAVAAAL